VKPGIHPEYQKANIACACGNVIETYSTRNYSLDVCSACHPFFSGKQKLIDTAGRVDRFRKKYARATTPEG
jgi:large subunit ribosomal protein L31